MDTATVLVMAHIAHRLDFLAAARLARLNRHWYYTIRHGSLFWVLWAQRLFNNQDALLANEGRNRKLRGRVPLVYCVRIWRFLNRSEQQWLLGKCITQSQLDLFTTLLDHGIAADLQTWYKAVASPQAVDCVNVLLRYPVTLTQQERGLVVDSACHLRNPNVPCVELLLDSDHFSPTEAVYYFAYRNGDVSLAILAKEHVLSWPAGENSFLSVACSHGHIDLVRWHLTEFHYEQRRVTLTDTFLHEYLHHHHVVKLLLPFIRMDRLSADRIVDDLIARIPKDAPHAYATRQMLRDYYARDVAFAKAMSSTNLRPSSFQ